MKCLNVRSLNSDPNILLYEIESALNQAKSRLWTLAEINMDYSHPTPWAIIVHFGEYGPSEDICAQPENNSIWVPTNSWNYWKSYGLSGNVLTHEFLHFYVPGLYQNHYAEAHYPTPCIFRSPAEETLCSSCRNKMNFFEPSFPLGKKRAIIESITSKRDEFEVNILNYNVGPLIGNGIFALRVYEKSKYESVYHRIHFTPKPESLKIPRGGQFKFAFNGLDMQNEYFIELWHIKLDGTQILQDTLAFS